MKKVKRYKSTRKYRCPYCNITATRDKLAAHIEDKHEAMIPEGYTAARVVYDYINKKNYGTCLVCKKKVYEWDDNVCRYKNICDDPKCLATLKERAGHNHLEDPEVQKKLLAGRRISGQYTFHDGVTHSYVGSYERNCFEFMDTVLNIPGKDIMSPGPTIYYEYKGEEHPWILDWMYIPAMLCADVKDGGSNPNNRPMEEYREKQLAKEEAISKLGKYNYIRLTDNNFSQLLEALADIRMGSMHHDPLSHIYINEAYQISDETKKMVAGLEQYFPEVSNAKFVTNYPKFQYEDAYKLNEKSDDILPEILELNEKLNGYEYGIFSNGKFGSAKQDAFLKTYKVATPAQFEAHKGGVCWDFAAYEYDYFKKHFSGVTPTAWFVVFDNNNDCPTHTFITFKYKGKVYYFESSFGALQGVWVANSEKDIISMVMDKMAKTDSLGRNYFDLGYEYYVLQYNPLDSKFIGVDPKTYMDNMGELIDEGKNISFTYSPNYKVKKMDKKTIEEAVGGMPSFRGNGSDYIVPHMMNGIEFHDDGRPMMTFGNTASDDVLQFDYMMKPHKHKKHDDYMMPLIDSYRFICKSNILPSLINDTKTLESLGEDGLIEKMTGRKFTGFKDLLCEDVVKISSDTDNDLVRSLITNGIVKNVTSVINESKMIAIQEEFVESKGDISIYKDTDGFFCCTPQDYYLVSNHYDTYEDIPQAVIDTMQVMYTRRKGGKQ